MIQAPARLIDNIAKGQPYAVQVRNEARALIIRQRTYEAVFNRRYTRSIHANDYRPVESGYA